MITPPIKTKETQQQLTEQHRLAILNPPCSSKDGICNPENIGVKTPQPIVAFLCASFSTAFRYAYSIMAWSLGQPYGWPVPISGIANLFDHVARRFATKGGGLSPILESTVMNSHAQGKACPKSTDQTQNPTTRLKINPPRRVSLDEIIKQQNVERGLTPLPLEVDLLLKRVADGGYSGQFLADAFISAYRTDISFPHSLGGLIKLDAEAFRLFHECLHVRHLSGWSDDTLYAIEQQINAIVGGAA